MQKFILKTVSIISFFLAIMFLEGCSNNEIITEKYENKMYEYSLDVPRNWGAVWIWPNSHELVDEMEAIGPVPNSREDWNEDIEIEIFNKENTSERVFKEYNSLIDFYEEFRLGNSVHFTDVKLNKLLTNKKDCSVKEVNVFQNGKYSQTRRLMENENGLYVFSFDKDNDIHQKIINSIELD